MFIAHKVYISDSGEVLEMKDLIKNNPTIAGSIEYEIEDQMKFAKLYNLNIKEEYRRKGFATKLRTFAINKIKSNNISEIITSPLSYSDTFSTEKLVAFYKRNFKELGATNINQLNLFENRVQLTAIF